jgi:hypothetical protein
MSRRPSETEYASFYAPYLALVPEEDILPVLASQNVLLRRLMDSVPEERETFRYAPGKWSIRELLGHIGDAERVFGFRAFVFSRGDQNPFPGFDENAYVAESGYDSRSLESLAGDFTGLREVNLALLRRLSPEAWLRTGIANGKPVSVRALAYVMAGHLRHHLGVLRERYSVGAGLGIS